MIQINQHKIKTHDVNLAPIVIVAFSNSDESKLGKFSQAFEEGLETSTFNSSKVGFTFVSSASSGWFNAGSVISGFTSGDGVEITSDAMVPDVLYGEEAVS